MLVAILIGFVTGWLISMPVGPLNAAAISRTIKKGMKAGFAVGLGGALMDFIYCAGSAKIHEYLLASPLINLIFQVIGFIALSILGISTLRSNKLASEDTDIKDEAEAEERMKRFHLSTKGLLAMFFLGILLYASNVAAIPEWIFLTALWRSYHLLDVGYLADLAFALGAGLGTAGWFLTLVRFIAKRRRGFQPRTLKIINTSAGVALIGFGIYFAIQIIVQTDWHRIGHYFSA